MLQNFTPHSHLQTDLLQEVDLAAHDKQQRKAVAVDTIKNRYGPHSMQSAAEILSDLWQPMAKIRSPRYVSNWQELPKIRPIKL